MGFKQVSTLAGALGSIIGYLGAEVAQEQIFERLLWPQRYFNDLDIVVFFQLAFLMPMGGPLHRAALASLDTFQKNGLYLGKRRGNLLGTVFMTNMRLKYRLVTQSNMKHVAKDTRNGFWVEVLRNLRPKVRHPIVPVPPDTETMSEVSDKRRRASQYVHHLVLEYRTRDARLPPTAKVVSEVSCGLRAITGVLASELTAVAAAVYAGLSLHYYWLVSYFCFPLLLKLLSVGCSVFRESVLHDTTTEQDLSLVREIFEIDDLNAGFALIEGPEPVVRQFFRHYGHPIRDHRSSGPGDRVREVACMAIVYMFVIHFPIGLIALMWMDQEAQYLWLSYQIYTIFVMHIVRVTGLGGVARTEQRIAKHLQAGFEVWLMGKNHCAVAARAETHQVENVEAGRAKADSIIKTFLTLR